MGRAQKKIAPLHGLSSLHFAIPREVKGSIRRWCDKFGAAYAAQLKRRRPRLGDKWFLDEVFLKINDVQHYLWRAVDQHRAVIDILVQPKRDRFAAIRFFRKLLRTSGRRPRV